MLKPLVILGPTAVGKTALSIKLAKEIDGEIISSDSVQIYKFMDIGSAKPTFDEQNRVKHHRISVKYPDEVFSSGEFVKAVNGIIEDAAKRKKNIIIVGGGGFYIDALVFGIDKRAPVDNKIKRFFDDICDEMSPPYLYSLLKIVDEKWAEKIESNDCQRIKRGLSVYFDSKKMLSDFFTPKSENNIDKFNIFVLYASKAFIDKRIEERTEEMVERGLIDEVKKLIDMGYVNTNALNSIGYKEVVAYLLQKIDKQTAIKLIKKHTKAYAKRQLTLLKSRFSDARWIDIEKEDAFKVILDVCKPSV